MFKQIWPWFNKNIYSVEHLRIQFTVITDRKSMTKILQTYQTENLVE